MSLRIVHVELRDANAFVSQLHRHHKKAQGHRFSVGCADAEGLRGVAIVGRPVARLIDQVNTVEVTRLCTDGSKNACSFLYSAAARAARELGYKKIQTYILEEESGVSLRAAGWGLERVTKASGWTGRKNRKRDPNTPSQPKQLWSKTLN